MFFRKNRKKAGRDEFSGRLVTYHAPNSEEAEWFRIIRTNLLFWGVDHPFRSVAIVSALPGEGKSFITVNMAVVLAQSGKRVLLVDTDFRRPTLHKYFNISREHGLSSLFVRATTFSKAVVHTPIPDLFFLPAGPTPPNPAELLASEAMGSLCKEFSSHYDFVLFDTPPILLVSDGVVLSSHVDGAILVVRARRTRKDDAKKAIKLLEKSGSRVLGAIFNGSSVDRRYYGHEYYQINSR